MASEQPKGGNGSGQPVFSEADIAQARQWFEKAKAVFDTRNYDYAIECYINGLEQWPLAVEEGHMPLMFVALTRAGAGGKKAGAMEALRRGTGGKDYRKAMLNAEFLLAKDPKNVALLEAVFKNAAKAQYDDVAMWIGPMYRDACAAEKKPSPARFRLLTDTYVEIAERQAAAGRLDVGLEAYQRALDAISRLRQADPKNLDLTREQTEIATKLTILRGRYETADSFQDSVRDADSQKDIHDAERVVQSDERLDDLITKAKAELQASPDVPAKVYKVVDLLCKREEDRYEDEAIAILMKAFEASGNYAFKLRADDIRMRQMNRRSLAVRASGDREAAKRQLIEQLRLELGVFRERVQQYPTDLRIRFEYGKRLFQAKRFDEAIPIFQQARNDPKNRTPCSYYVGRCFYEKEYYDQAIDVLKTAIQGYEMEGDAMSKDLHYWLGRAYEAAGNKADAMKVYGQIIQWDYDFKDVRQRMDNLRGKG